MASGLIAIVAIAWLSLLRDAAGMAAMTAEARMHAAMGMADMRSWGASDWFALFVMWTVMMVAMMLPSAAPVMLLVIGMYRRRGDAAARRATVLFASGYVLVWTGFSAIASSGQLLLHRAAFLSDDMRLRSAAVAGAVLILAGIYQWLPVKNRCLTYCQSPLGFLTQHWREGAAGGLVLGLRHGGYCVGCCWLLMALLFVLGVMNLFWVAALAVFVLIEKLAHRGGRLAGRVAGLAGIAWGIYLLVRG